MLFLVNRKRERETEVMRWQMLRANISHLIAQIAVCKSLVQITLIGSPMGRGVNEACFPMY